MTKKDSLVDYILGELSESLKVFITLVNTPVKWEILNFFHNNPNTIGTAYDIAKYIGRNPELVEKEIQELVEDKIFIDCGEIWGRVPWAEYTQFYKLNEEMKENIAAVVALSEKHGKKFERILFNSLNFSLHKLVDKEISHRFQQEVG